MNDLTLTGICSKCGGPQDRPDQRYCRACHAAYQREHRPKPSELSAEAQHKLAARTKAGIYSRRGLIEQRPCQVCGSEKAERHHENYDKPLEIIWLCRPCHTTHHRMEKFREQFKVLGWSRDASFIEVRSSPTVDKGE
jgi:hypothetical protein